MFATKTGFESVDLTSSEGRFFLLLDMRCFPSQDAPSVVSLRQTVDLGRLLHTCWFPGSDVLRQLSFERSWIAES